MHNKPVVDLETWIIDLVVLLKIYNLITYTINLVVDLET